MGLLRLGVLPILELRDAAGGLLDHGVRELVGLVGNQVTSNHRADLDSNTVRVDLGVLVNLITNHGGDVQLNDHVSGLLGDGDVSHGIAPKWDSGVSLHSM